MLKDIKIFTFLTQEDIEALIIEHKEAPHLRILQKRLAKEITSMVHSKQDCENAEKASTILFSKTFKEDIKTLDEATFLEMEGHLSGIDLKMVTEATDETDLNGQVACAGGACEIV